MQYFFKNQLTKKNVTDVIFVQIKLIVPFRVILSSGLTAATVINNKMPSLKCDKVVFIMQLIV